MEKEEIIRTGKIWLEGDGIVRFTYFPKVEVTLADAKKSIAVVLKISKGKTQPLFVDSRGIKSMEREARTYYAGEEAAKAVSACALLIGSPISRVIGNFFLGINKPKFPVKLFTSESEAIEWLRRFIE